MVRYENYTEVLGIPDPIEEKFMYLVYLAGPITGLSYDAATDWRKWFSALLPPGIQALSPLRGKGYLKGESSIRDAYQERVLSTGRAITTRDYNDVRRCDLVVVNLLGAERVSIGTVMEIAWAKAFQIPVILVTEDAGNIHEHSMISECVGFRVNNLEDAVRVARVVLLADVSEMCTQRDTTRGVPG